LQLTAHRAISAQRELNSALNSLASSALIILTQARHLQLPALPVLQERTAPKVQILLMIAQLASRVVLSHKEVAQTVHTMTEAALAAWTALPTPSARQEVYTQGFAPLEHYHPLHYAKKPLQIVTLVQQVRYAHAMEKQHCLQTTPRNLDTFTLFTHNSDSNSLALEAPSTTQQEALLVYLHALPVPLNSHVLQVQVMRQLARLN